MGYRPTLDCQECGAVLRRLTLAEAQEVAARPYDFVAYCRDCLTDVRAEAPSECLTPLRGE